MRYLVRMGVNEWWYKPDREFSRKADAIRCAGEYGRNLVAGGWVQVTDTRTDTTICTWLSGKRTL